MQAKQNKRARFCNMGNIATKMANCVDKAHSKLMNCQLPWMKVDDEEDKEDLGLLRPCNTTDDLRMYQKLAEMNRDYESNELKILKQREKCQPNCESSTWKATLVKTKLKTGNNNCGENCLILAFSSDQRQVHLCPVHLRHFLGW